MKQSRSKTKLVPIPQAWQLRRPQHNIYSRAMLSTVCLMNQVTQTAALYPAHPLFPYVLSEFEACDRTELRFYR
jgi:hypothetical protein